MSKNDNNINNSTGEEEISKIKVVAESGSKSQQGKQDGRVGTNSKENNEDDSNEQEQDDVNKDDELSDQQEEQEEDKDKQEDKEEDKEEGKQEDKEEDKQEDKEEGKEEGKDQEYKSSDKKDSVTPDKRDSEDSTPNKRVKQPNRRDMAADKAQTNDKGKEPAKEAKDVANNALGENANKGKEHLESAKKTAKIAKNIAKVAKTTLMVFTKVISSPITWVVIVALILLLWIMAFQTVVGRNDYNESCDFNGSGVISISNDADDHTRKSAITGWLTSTPFVHMGDKPMTKEMAFGILGNLIQESSNGSNYAFQGESLQHYQTCDNACVLAIGKDVSTGIGIVQWDRTRRVGLVNHADSTGKPWYDLQTQLDFLKTELDGSHGKALSNAGFFETTKTVKDYTEIWEEIFEVSADDAAMIARRVRYAEEWATEYTGSGGTVGSCVGGAVDASNIVQLAIQVSYSRAERATGLGYGRCENYVGCGAPFSKPEYIEAKRLAEETTSADPSPGALASCDRFVATMVRLTGMDEGFPWGAVSHQIEYMSRPNSGWEQVTCPNRMPGDIIARPGHIMLYIGEHEGRDSLASASIADVRRLQPDEKGRSAQIGNLSCSGDSFDADSGMNTGWRKVGK